MLLNPRFGTLFLLSSLMWLSPSVAHAENEGLETLDKATRLKVNSQGDLPDLNDVIDLLDSAIEKGLDEENRRFAEELLVSTLLQRAESLSRALLERPLKDPRRDPRWIQIRQFALTDLHRALELNRNLWEAHLLIGRLQALQLGDPNAARRALGKVVDSADAPDAARAKALAMRAPLQSDPQKREADLGRAIELEPHKPDYYRVRAQYYLGKKEFETALADIDEAVELEPEHEATREMRGLVLLKLDRLDDALVSFDLGPDEPNHHRIRAQYHYGKDDFEAALADIDKAIELEADHAASYELRGLVLLGLDRLDDALASFNKVGELMPDAVLPYQRRGEVYRRLGDLEKAIGQLTKALEFVPNDAATLTLRGSLRYQLKENESALADVEKAIELQPQLLIPHLLRAEILATTDRMDEAIRQLEQLVPRAPHESRLLEPLATYYLLAGQSQQAIEAFGRLIDANPDNMRALRFRGDAYLAIGKHAEAVADFDRALELEVEDEGLLNNFAWVLATSPDNDVRDGARALELATKAAEATSYEMPHVLSTLAAAYAETGDFESAIKWAEKAVKLAEEAIELAVDEDALATLKSNHKQLQQELASFQAGQPIRERQGADGVSDEPAAESSPSEDDPLLTPAPIPDAVQKSDD